MSEPFCCRCKENFPLYEEPPKGYGLSGAWRMGTLRKLSKAPRKIRDQFQEWLKSEEGGYLCGNCYYDMTD